jgi:hypothetical protein
MFILSCDAQESNLIYEAYETTPDTNRSARHINKISDLLMDSSIIVHRDYINRTVDSPFILH